MMLIRLARNMVYFYIDLASAVFGDFWRECQAVARSRR